MTEISENFRAGYVAVVGLPNSGKSTLLNRILNYKISIVTHRPQTTRKSVIGIYNGDQYQIVFMDTPGILKPEYNLQKMMMKYVSTAISDADCLLYLVDISEKRRQPVADIKAQLASAKGKPVILILNKIDMVRDKKKLLPLINEYASGYPFESIIPISAEKRDGVDIVLNETAKHLPLSPPYYPTDYVSDQQERFFVAEIIREKVFKFYGDEVPYSCHVDIEEFREQSAGKTFIRGLIITEKETQKQILIGKNGEALKKIGAYAREDIEAFLDRKVFLEIYVKIKKDWRKKDMQLRQMGYTR